MYFTFPAHYFCNKRDVTVQPCIFLYSEIRDYEKCITVSLCRNSNVFEWITMLKTGIAYFNDTVLCQRLFFFQCWWYPNRFNLFVYNCDSAKASPPGTDTAWKRALPSLQPICEARVCVVCGLDDVCHQLRRFSWNVCAACMFPNHQQRAASINLL